MAHSLRLLILVAFAVIAAASPLAHRAVPLPPGIDPFYLPPAGFEKEPPGTILRNRSVVTSYFGTFPTGINGNQLLYRTTAINGSAIATVTTIFQPVEGALTDRFISFQAAYDASAIICDPSYTYQLGAPQTNLIASSEQGLLEAYLASGYIVASADYEGPDAAFGAGPLAGMGVLDSIRAVSSFTALGFSSTPKVVGVGYSGGAIATGWAASLQKSYAPDVNVKGWAAGGVPVNLTVTAITNNGGLFSGLVLDAFEGLLKPSAYAAQLTPILNQIITPYGRTQLDFAAANCGVQDVLEFADQSIFSTKFQSLGDRLFYNPTVAATLKKLTLGTEKDQAPIVPVYLYQATQDELISYANVSTLATEWCNYGSSVNFTTFAAGGHVTTEVLGFPGVLDFVESAFAGTVAKGCSRSTVLSDQLSPVALGANLEPILVKLIEVLNTAGVEDANIIQNLTVLKQPV